MPNSISHDHLLIIRRESDVAARRLLRQLRLSRDDLDDLRQDLLVDLLARLSGFDPGRGTMGAFAGLVMVNRARRIAKKVFHHRRMFGVHPLSLDEPLANGDGATRGDLVPEEEGLAAFLGQPVNAAVEAHRRLDVELALGALPRSDRELCSHLVDRSPNELSLEGQGSRASIYRRVYDIRLLVADE